MSETPISVLIADDDKLIRNDIRTMIDWEAQGFAIVAEARNGREALDLLSRKQTELLITDIYMPIMDGVALIREAKQRRPDLQVLVLSNYDDFASVKEAMRFGAQDYLLKYQLDEPALEQFLRQAGQRIREARLDRDAKRKADAREWLKAALDDEAPPEGKTGTAGGALFLPLLVRVRCTEKEASGRLALEGLSDLPIMELEPELFALPIRVHTRSRLYLLQQLQETLETVKRAFRDLPYAVAYAPDAVGSPKRGYSRLTSALERYFYEGPERRVYELAYNDRYNEPGPQVDRTWYRLAEDLAEAFESADESVWGQAIDRYAERMERERYPVALALREWAFALRQMIQSLRLIAADTDELDPCEDFVNKLGTNRWITLADLREKAVSLRKLYLKHALLQDKAGGVRADVLRAIEYIQTNYRRNLTLQEVSEQIGLSKNHFCILFRQETGEHFKDFLYMLRMEEAKRLIVRRSHRVTEVADQVGIGNYRSFCKQFKKYTGCNPNEYRKSRESG